MNLNLDRLLDLKISLINQEFILKHFEKAFHIPEGKALTIKNVLKRKEARSSVKKISEQDVPVIREIATYILFNKIIHQSSLTNTRSNYNQLLDYAQKERIKMDQLDLNLLISELKAYVQQV